MATERNPNSFGTYLETLLTSENQATTTSRPTDIAQQSEHPNEQQAGPSAQPPPMPAPNSSTGSSPPTATPLKPALVLLNILAGSDSLLVSDLLQKSGMEIQDFASALTSLQSEDLISYVGEAAGQEVQLTPSGRALLQPTS